MMDAVFLKLLNMSISASWLIVAVFVLRILLKKAPREILCALWALVAIRLICPFSFESVLSLIPSAETFPQKVISGPSFDVNTGINMIDTSVNGYLGDHYFEGVTVHSNNDSDFMTMLGLIWIAGVAIMLLYAIISYLKLRKKVSEGVELRDNIWLCDLVDTPFILGVIRPRIFLPSAMHEQQIDYVVAHEKAHLARRDHWWKPLGFVLLALYWFNPFCWVAFWLLCKDIELACDEKVIKDLDAHKKKAYSEVLLSCSVTRRTIVACPLAFGEVGVKERIKTVLNYKKPAFWMIALAVIAAIVLTVCFLTNPKNADAEGTTEKTETTEAAQNDFILTYNDQPCSLDSDPSELDASVWETDYTGNVLAWLGTANADVTTARGIHVGSTKAEVMAAYGITGDVARERAAELWYDLGDSEPLSDRLTFYFDAEGMKEVPDTAKVTQITLERRALTWTEDDFKLLSTADFTLIEGKTGKLSLYGSQLENGNYGVSHVQIIWEDGTTTGFDTKEAVTAAWDEGDRTEAWSKDGGLVTADFNFDGYTDIALQAWVAASNHPDYYWFYNRATGEFEYFGCLNGEAAADGANREFTVEYHDSMTYYTDHYHPNDAGSVYLAQRDVLIYGENGETAYTETYGKNEHPITYADFDHDGTDESVVVVDQGDFVYDLQVRRQDAAVLWQQELATAHAGWSSLFLHINADGAALLQYSPYMSTGSAYYSYTLFTLENGQENILSRRELSFSTDGKDAPEKEEFDSFADEINGLLADSFLLFSTENGTVEYGLKSAEEHYETFSDFDWLSGES